MQVPVGGEEAAVVVATVGEQRQFDFDIRYLFAVVWALAVHHSPDPLINLADHTVLANWSNATVREQQFMPQTSSAVLIMLLSNISSSGG